MSESVIHVLKDCMKSAEVWMLLVPAGLCVTFFSYRDLKPWMEWNLKATFMVNGISWQTMFPLVCHQLWLARNNRIFNEGDINPQVIIKVKAYTSWGGGSTLLNILNGYCIERWVAPDREFVKLNVDGACNVLGGSTACAGIMRDCKGKVRGGFLFNKGRGDPYSAERWAILMGLKWSWEFGVRHLVIESDCLEIVQQIKKHREVNEDIEVKMIEILSFFRRAWDMSIVWCKREANGVADKLAKHVLTIGAGFVGFKHVPTEVADMVTQEQEFVKA